MKKYSFKLLRHLRSRRSELLRSLRSLLPQFRTLPACRTGRRDSRQVFRTFASIFQRSTSKPKKRKLLLIATCTILILGPTIFLLAKSANKTAAAWWDDTWGYRQTVPITNAGTAQTDYQIAITLDTATLITAGKMQSDCDDIRITDIGGKLLPYWISNCNNASTKIWPKIPSLPTTGATVYLYYGNPSASAGKSKVGTQTYPGLSCKTILDAGDSNGTGNYWIDPTNGNSSDSFQAYCDMTNDSGGWMLVTQTMIQSEANSSTSNVKTTDANGGLINTITLGGVLGCTSKSYQMLLKDTIPWTKIKADYEYYGGNSCWGVFGNGSQGPGSNLISYQAGTDTIRNQVKMGGSAGDNFDGTTSRCDNETTNFWHANQGNVTRSAQAILRRNSMGSYAGLSNGVACTGYTNGWKYQNIYIREDSMEPANITVSSPTNEERSEAPVAYWKFDEGYGATTNNSTSVTGINGTLSGTSIPTWQTEDQCISGKCLKFDGNTSSVQVASTNIDYTAPFSISMWFYGNDFANPDAPELFNQQLSGGWINLRVGYSNELEFQVKTASGTMEINSPNNYISTNKWYYITAVYDPSTSSKLFINGVQMSDTSTTNAGTITKSGNTRIGVGFNGWEWNGKIDEPKIYPYARTAAQIKADFAARGTSKGSAATLSGVEGSNLSNGLVGYWKMDEASANSCTGGVNDACDSSGNSLDGAWTGNATAAAGKYGNGVTFDGTGDYIPITHNQGNNIKTVSAWVKLNAMPTGTPGGIILANASATSNPSAFDKLLRVTTSGKIEYYFHDGTGRNATGTTTLTTGTWYHVVGVSYADKTVVYLNGSEEGNYASVSTYSGNNMIIDFDDTYYSSYAQDINGSIDEVRIYNRALSDKEVRDLYSWAPGPVAYYDFEEGSGAVLNDKSGNNRNGSYVGSPQFSSGKFGKGMRLTTTGQYATIPGLGNYVPAQEITIEYWAKPDSVSGYQNAFWIGTDTPDRINVHYYWNGTQYWDFGTCCTPRIALSPGIVAGQWDHFAYVSSVQGNYMRIYKNGVQIGSNTVPGTFTPANYPLYIGNQPNGSYPLLGTIDDFKIYNYARTPGQIIEDMNAGHPLGGSPVGSQVGYWKFDEGYGTNANDSSSQNNTLSITNATWQNAGKFGKALYFDGTGDFATKTDTNNAHDLTTGTITFWAKLNDNYRSIAVTKGDTESNPVTNYYVGTGSASKWLCGIGNGTTQQDLIDTNTATTNVWTYVACAFDGNRFRLYINGVIVDDDAQTITPQTNNGGLQIGRWGTGATYEFNGFLDEVKIYNAALTEDEILLDYNHGSAMVLGESVENRDRVTSGQTLYLDATDKNSYPGSGTNWYDLSGNNYNATLSSPTWNGLKFTNTTATLTGLGSSVYPNIATNTTILWVYPEVGGGTVWSVTDMDAHTYMSYLGTAYINTWETGTYNQRTTWSITAGVPHQVVITKNGSVRTVYDNLVQKGQVTITNIATSVNSNLAYGRAAEPMGLSIVETYNRVLSMDEITQDYYAHAYKFNINAEPVAEWKMDEKTGSYIYDTSGNGYTGTLTSSPTWTQGKVGGSLNYNSSSQQYVEVASPVINTPPFTACVWVMPTSITPNKYFLSNGGQTSGSYGYSLRLDSSSNWAFNAKNSSGLGGETSATPTSTAWTFVCGTWDGSSSTGSIKLYINGQLANTATPGAQAFGAAQNLRIGAPSNTTSYSWDGKIDQVKIYNYARTPAQIAYDYNRGAPVGHWKLDECQGLVANDSSGNGNSGTITIGGGGTNTSAGTCTGSAGQAWKDGATGKYSSSLEFDGTDDKVSMNDSNFPSGANPFSFSFWMKPSGTGTPLSWGTATTNQAVLTYYDTGNSKTRFGRYGNDILTPTITQALNVWSHVSYTYDGSILTAYINGVPAGTTSVTLTTVLNSGRIGNVVGDSQYFPGQIDDVRVYNYALTPTQIKTLYNENSAIRFGP